MLGIGLIEGFFGPEWSWEARHHICESLRSSGGDFYIYAPKRDSYLRKNWTQSHPPEIWEELKKMSSKCFQKNVTFGIGLSPFEIHTQWNQPTKNRLRDKINSLVELNPQYLGLFFDDMKGAPDLAERQIEIVEYVKSITDKTLLFCPTYYSDDPILDKVFGQRPVNYLEKVGCLPPEVQIFWTGRKVIPQAISGAELEDVAKLLKRKPLIWDNYFANHGPKQCKFLKLKAFEGRTKSALENSAGWAFNLMNQPRLSEIVFSASVQVLRGTNPAIALENEIGKVADSEILKKHRVSFLEKGLDGIDDQAKGEIARQLTAQGPSEEIRDWLQGKYLVGDECLTD